MELILLLTALVFGDGTAEPTFPTHHHPAPIARPIGHVPGGIFHTHQGF